MDEQRKYAILFAATILAARKLHEIAEQILRKIDECGPTKVSP